MLICVFCKPYREETVNVAAVDVDILVQTAVDIALALKSM